MIYSKLCHKQFFYSLNLQQDNKDNKMLRLIISLTLLSLSLANIVKRSEYTLFRPHTIQYNTIQYNTIQYNTIQYNTIQYNTIQYNTIQYNTIQYNTIQYNTIQYNTIQYNTIQYNTIQLLFHYAHILCVTILILLIWKRSTYFGCQDIYLIIRVKSTLIIYMPTYDGFVS